MQTLQQFFCAPSTFELFFILYNLMDVFELNLAYSVFYCVSIKYDDIKHSKQPEAE